MKFYCSTNPFLLPLLLTVTPISLYKSEVQQTVTNFVCQNLNFNSRNFKSFLSVCRVYFDLETTRSILDENSQLEFYNSWLFEEMAMTLNEDNTLKLNFPTLPTVLNNFLTKSLNEEQDICEVRLKKL